MSTALEQYELMMTTYDPELFVTKKQIEDLKKRGYGTATVEYKVQAGKVIAVDRLVRISNQTDHSTQKISILY